jgi:FtsP/CotA-like multicopper oxidase with cupredoxin domain
VDSLRSARRRKFLASALGAAAAPAIWFSFASGSRPPTPPPDRHAGRSVPLRLVAAERPTTLPCFAGQALPLWTFSLNDWLPVVRIDSGDRLDVVLENWLPRSGEHTSIHWHGIRLPNAEDGVPYLVQPPVQPGESYRYEFTPPDTGTFWFHTHCNTVEQLGRGLMGVLIVEGDAVTPYDADEVIVLRDWRVDVSAGVFKSFTTRRGAHRAGTLGSVRSANGAGDAVLRLPASGDCRLRILNADPTRVVELAVEDAEAAAIAIDGIAVPPFVLDSWLLGPGMRIDLAMRSPPAGSKARLVDRRAADPAVLILLEAEGKAMRSGSFDAAPLRSSRIPEPERDGAEVLTFSFGDTGRAELAEFGSSLEAAIQNSLCLSSEEYWTINSQSWPGRDHSRLPPPVAILERGRSYVFRLVNATKLIHPIHIHGHSFKVLRSDQRALRQHTADTVLLMPEETVDVAFVADNPGKWMFHCHVIEHQEAGMMSYVVVA